MSASQQRAVAAHRRRLADRGITRYEVRGRAQDKGLIRRIAQRLTADDPASAEFRLRLERELGGPLQTGREIWDALRRSPLVGVDLNLEREIVPLRDIDL